MVGPAQVEGMVGDDHIDAALDGLLDDGGDRVDRQEDRADGLRGIAADELVGVPGLGELGRGRGAQHGDDIRNGGGSGGCVRRGIDGLRGKWFGGAGSDDGLAHE